MDELDYRGLPLSQDGREKLKQLDKDRIATFRDKVGFEPKEISEHDKQELIRGRLRDYWACLLDTPATPPQREQWLRDHATCIRDNDAWDIFRKVAETHLPVDDATHAELGHLLAGPFIESVVEEILEEACKTGATPDHSDNQSIESSNEAYEPAWTLRGGGDKPETPREAFGRLARRAMKALGQKFADPAAAVDSWLERVSGYLKARQTGHSWDDWHLTQLEKASAEYCAELATRFHEAENQDAEKAFKKLEWRFRQLPEQGPGLSAIRRTGTGVPELSESIKRKLVVQWDTLRDNNKLTEDHLSGYDRERQRLLGMPANPPSHVRPLRPHAAARDVGLDPSIRAAEARFRGADWEYWLLWCSSGFGYEVYRE